MMPIVRSGPDARTGAVRVLLGQLVSWVAEFITAAAWQDPPYAPLYKWVSHLGLIGPSQVAFQQVGTPRSARSWTPAGCSTESC